MDYNEVLPFLQGNHLAVITTVGSSGRAQSTVVRAGAYDGKMAFVSREPTVKVKNVRRGGRCVVTSIKPDNTRFVTVEGPAAVTSWGDVSDDDLLSLLRDVYTAVGRPPSSWDDFDGSMRKEQRCVVIVEPERVYGSI